MAVCHLESCFFIFLQNILTIMRTSSFERALNNYVCDFLWLHLYSSLCGPKNFVHSIKFTFLRISKFLTIKLTNEILLQSSSFVLQFTLSITLLITTVLKNWCSMNIDETVMHFHPMVILTMNWMHFNEKWLVTILYEFGEINIYKTPGTVTLNFWVQALFLLL